jgi:hypothetical protein
MDTYRFRVFLECARLGSFAVKEGSSPRPQERFCNFCRDKKPELMKLLE